MDKFVILHGVSLGVLFNLNPCRSTMERVPHAVAGHLPQVSEERGGFGGN